MAPTPPTTGRGRIRALAFPVLLIALVALAWQLGWMRQMNFAILAQQADALAAAGAAHPLAAAAAFFAAYVLVAALPLPGAALLSLAAGAIFGVAEGIVLVSFASALGATVASANARYWLRDALRARLGARSAAFDAGVARDGVHYLLGLRLAPVVPFFLVNVLAGLSPLRLRTIYLASQAGMFPATAVYVAAGTRLGQVRSVGDVLSPGVLLAMTALALLPFAAKAVTLAWQRRRLYAPFRRPRRFDYNLIAIGAGSAGLVTSYVGAAVNARVALIERQRMGGDCLNTGCVPSKALIRAARRVADIREAERFGIVGARAEVDFSKVMARVQRVVEEVAPHDSVERYNGLGVEVIAGDARLVSPWEVEVAGRRLSARSIVIATGARPLVPPIPGLDAVEILTSDTLWELRALPARLLVLGGGPIGCELAQCFARFGAQVTLVEMAPQLLPREDAEVGALVARRLADDGVQVATSHRAQRIEPGADGRSGVLIAEQAGQSVTLPFDRILVALGRTPNTEGLGLEAMGIELGARGQVAADGFARTRFPNVLAAGDVAGPYQFTHAAAHQAWHAALNGLLAPFWSFRLDYSALPWVTFVDPEVARVGLSEADADAQGIAVEVTRFELAELDRAIADGATDGFVKVLTAGGSDRIVGACIVGAHAGELLPEFVLAMRHGLGLNKILATIHAYPTLGEANKYAAGAWKRAHAPQAALRWAARYFIWRREGTGTWL